EAKVYPSLSIIWDDVIYVEVRLPNNILIKNLEKEFDSIFGAECTNLGTNVHLRLWIAFSIEKIPNSLKEKEKKIGKISDINKAS
ncbi:MAG: hypothetical protein K2X69_01560, partial [Silvanigrellaceae bacterium]|nr:hypothetical protein [Silvanigrellaceae bacterium]